MYELLYYVFCIMFSYHCQFNCSLSIADAGNNHSTLLSGLSGWGGVYLIEFKVTGKVWLESKF